MSEKEFEKILKDQIAEVSKRIDGLREVRDLMKPTERKYSQRVNLQVLELQKTRTSMTKALAAYRKTMKGNK